MTALTQETPARSGIGARKGYHAPDAQLNQLAPDSSIQFAKDQEAAGEYFRWNVVGREYGNPMSGLSNSEYYNLIPTRGLGRPPSARDSFRTLAELQFESGYSYALVGDTVNAANPLDGWINISNLCSQFMLEEQL